MRRIRPVSHDDKLSVVDHLDELRSRLIVSLAAFVVAWALTTWQNHLVLEIMNAPLPDGKEPITLGPTEAFTTTLMNAAYFALILAAPVILYEIYAFVLPAFSPSERRVATPLLVMVPVLFITGVVFCYFVVLTPALHFLLNFNASEFNTQIRAKDYYSFISMLMLVMGLGFQIPIGILAACKLGITSAEQLRRNRRYAIVADRGAGGAPAHARPDLAPARVAPLLPPLRAQHRSRGALGPSGVRRERRARNGGRCS